MDNATRFSLNLVFQYAAVFLTSLLGILIIPFLIRLLGKDAFGLTAVFGSIFAIAQLLELGVGVSLARTLSVALELKDFGEFSRFFCASLGIGIGLGIMVFLVSFLYAPDILVLLRVPDFLLEDASCAFRINAGYAVMLAFILPVFRAVFVSAYRFDMVSVVFMLLNVCQICLWYVMLSLTELGIVAWSLANVMAIFLVMGVSCWLIHRVAPFLHLDFLGVRRRHLAEIYRIGWKVSVDRIMGFSEVTINPILISRMADLSLNAIYKPVTQVMGAAVTMLLQGSSQMMPYVARASVQNDDKRVGEIYIVSLRLLLLVGVMSALFIGVYATAIFEMWLGSSLGVMEAETAAYAFIILYTAQVLSSGLALQTQILTGINCMNFMVGLSIVRTILGLIATILLLAFTDLGIYAVVWPASILKVVACILQSSYLTKLIPVGRFGQWRNAYLPMLKSAVPYAGILLILHCINFGTSSFGAFLPMVLAILLSLPIIWIFGAYPEDRERLKRVFRTLFGRVFSR